jgi:hypothetical protein
MTESTNDKPSEDGAPATSCPPEGNHPQLSAIGREILSGLLDRQGLASLRSDSPPLEQDQWRAVREVADKHRGEPLMLDPIVIDLVRSLVVRWFTPAARDEKMQRAWNAIADQIAASLYDDPVARDRLQTLWTRLAAA